LTMMRHTEKHASRGGKHSLTWLLLIHGTARIESSCSIHHRYLILLLRLIISYHSRSLKVAVLIFVFFFLLYGQPHFLLRPLLSLVLILKKSLRLANFKDGSTADRWSYHGNGLFISSEFLGNRLVRLIEERAHALI
jgi:hypothetical protein